MGDPFEKGASPNGAQDGAQSAQWRLYNALNVSDSGASFSPSASAVEHQDVAEGPSGVNHYHHHYHHQSASTFPSPSVSVDPRRRVSWWIANTADSEGTASVPAVATETVHSDAARLRRAEILFRRRAAPGSISTSI